MNVILNFAMYNSYEQVPKLSWWTFYLLVGLFITFVDLLFILDWNDDNYDDDRDDNEQNRDQDAQLLPSFRLQQKFHLFRSHFIQIEFMNY